mgnify:FL=1
MFILKFILLIVLAAGGYYGYQNHYKSEPVSKDGSLVEIINSNGYISAGEILNKSQNVVDFTCKDDEILKTWGSNSQECHERITNFQSMCESRIFPDVNARITDPKAAGKLYSRYADCLIPQAG